LEHDTGPVPQSAAEAWDAWTRKGVPQFRQPHNFMPGLRSILEAELPDLQDALRSAGAGRFDLVRPLPPSFADQSPQPIDDTRWPLTARRPVGEYVCAAAAQREPRVTIRRGVRVAELIAGAPALRGTPHVVGVRTADGEALHADLVVDASGRQSRAPQW